jgi:hypothetical protein
MSYTLIERKELTSNSATVEFTSIPQIFDDLIFLISPRGSGAGQIINGGAMTLNGSNSISFRSLFGNGSTTNVNAGSDGYYASFPGDGATANTFGNISVYIPNYRLSQSKGISINSVTEHNGTQSNQEILAGIWANNNAITSVSFTIFSHNYVPNSSFSLYGIDRQQAIGAPKAVGGQISFANGYWVHSFTGSGTFYTQEDLECQYLVIAGGGSGGGHDRGGGGGAGGYRSSVFGEISGGGSSAEARLSLAARTSHMVTVGAGGSGVGANTLGISGNPSTFSSITAIGGGAGGQINFNSGIGVLGGSGSGAGISPGGEQTRAGGSGTTNQGFAGGSSFHNYVNFGNAGGGGGAGSAGTGVVNTSGVGNGGAGVTSSITGSAITRAGGGGGGSGSVAVATGGSGGGGNGGLSIAPTSGLANTGSGGGGTGGTNTGTSGAGGSGIVIIRYKA